MREKNSGKTIGLGDISEIGALDIVEDSRVRVSPSRKQAGRNGDGGVKVHRKCAVL